MNGDGIVSQGELDAVVRSFYGTTAPQMTGLTVWGPGALQFGLSNAVGLDFNVLASTNLVDWLVQETVLLFWSPSCGFCQRVLPELRGWERKRPAGAPTLLIISSGAAEANRAMGLASPVLLDDTFRTGRLFGSAGTPSAVLIDSEGKVASGVSRRPSRPRRTRPRTRRRTRQEPPRARGQGRVDCGTPPGRGAAASSAARRATRCGGTAGVWAPR